MSFSLKNPHKSDICIQVNLNYFQMQVLFWSPQFFVWLLGQTIVNSSLLSAEPLQNLQVAVLSFWELKALGFSTAISLVSWYSFTRSSMRTLLMTVDVKSAFCLKRFRLNCVSSKETAFVLAEFIMSLQSSVADLHGFGPIFPSG